MQSNTRQPACFFASARPKSPLLLIPVFASLMAVFFALAFQMAHTAEGALNAAPAAAPPVCSDSGWTVADQSELDAAIDCFNGKTAAGSHTITLTQNISLTASTPTINNATAGIGLLIEGGGYTVDGQEIVGVRPFDIAADSDVTIQNITIMRGKTPLSGSGLARAGGGIRNSGTLTLTWSIVNDNSAFFGGGINNSSSGRLIISFSTLSNNSTSTQGGAINNSGILTINNSTLSGNTVSNIGGGLYTLGTVTISDSTFSGNSSGGQGGGIYNILGTLNLIRSTLSGNSGSYGGGIADFGISTIHDSIIANNPSSGECDGMIDSVSNNLSSDASCDFGAGNNINPLLGPLQGNGGPTWTHALLFGSPAIDAGSVGTLTDQRGTIRPQGSAPDIGAYELIQHTVSVAGSGTGIGSITSLPAGLNCVPTCTASFGDNFAITLTAMAETGSTFSGWSGDIVTTTNPLPLTINAAKSVTATFTRNQHALTTATDGTGSGSVSKTPDAAVYDYGTVVTLTATAETGSVFNGWSGGCSGTAPCVISMTESQSVTATFTRNQHALTIATDGTGSGSVSKTPDAAVYDYGTVVTLTATAETGSVFNGWSGGCSGTAPCVISMTESQNVTATFTLLQIFLPMVTVPPLPTYADLVVDSVTVTGDAEVEIVIRNSGQVPVTAEFWVDLYIGLKNPSVVPSQVNDIWQDFSPHGGAWLVAAGGLPLAPGETLTLRVADSYFDGAVSDIGTAIAADVPLYVLVDAADAENPVTGSVFEEHEQAEAETNNLFGPVLR